MHRSCFETLIQADYRCPTCKKSVLEMGHAWQQMEEALEAQLEVVKGEIPEEVLNRQEKCLCNDCEIKFDTTFNPFCMYKCPQCSGQTKKNRVLLSFSFIMFSLLTGFNTTAMQTQ